MSETSVTAYPLTLAFNAHYITALTLVQRVFITETQAVCHLLTVVLIKSHASITFDEPKNNIDQFKRR